MATYPNLFGKKGIFQPLDMKNRMPNLTDFNNRRNGNEVLYATSDTKRPDYLNPFFQINGGGEQTPRVEIKNIQNYDITNNGFSVLADEFLFPEAYLPTDGTGSTENSDFDTVLAIYSISSGSGWDSLEEVASDDNSGTDGQDSEVVFEASKDTVYLVAVEGAAGERGTVQLNQELAQKPEITSLSNDASVILGGTATLQVEASNPLANASLSYQWYQDGVAITGAVESSLIVADAGFNSAGNYTVAVSNYAGSVESAAVLLNVVQAVTIESQPESGEVSAVSYTHLTLPTICSV